MEAPTSPSLASPIRQNANVFNSGAAYSPTLDGSRGRKRNSSLIEQSSPEAYDNGHGTSQNQANGLSQSSRRAPGVKRACNECRQQKLRCDVLQDPFESCSRCKKQNLTCQIDESFRRIGKRSRHAELERRAAELEHENAILRQQMGTKPLPTTIPAVYPSHNGPAMYTYNLPGTGDDSTQDAVESLLNLQGGMDGNLRRGSRKTPAFRTLGNIVMVPREEIATVFEEYWRHHHRFLPLLDSKKPPEHYWNLSEFLFWTIIMVGCRHSNRERLAECTDHYKRLMWMTMTSVPQNHHIVKALCLLCTWPLPVSSTSQDPTIMHCGLMMNVALQIGLHRPSHAEDFSRSHIHLKEDDIKDRLMTWATCNIVAQSISTGYGLPPQTVYDSTLEPAMTLRAGPVDKNVDKDNVPLPENLRRRLELEKFANNVTQQVYGYNANSSSREQALFASMAADDLPKQFEPDRSQNASKANLKDNPFDTLYLGAVRLHIRLYAFFEAPTSTTYRRDLVHLYAAATEYLDAALALQEKGLRYAPNYIMQMMLAAAYTLCKLLNSFFVVRLEHDREHGCDLFAKTIAAVREMSVQSNDLPQRLSEVVVQLWHYSGAGKALDSPSAVDERDQSRTDGTSDVDSNAIAETIHTGDIDDSLQLKLRTRMSMSLVYDCVWRWRDELQGKVRQENLDAAVQNPTSPEAKLDSPKFPRRMSQLNSAAGTPLRPSTSGSAFAGSPSQAQAQAVMATAAMEQTISPAADVNGLANYGATPGAQNIDHLYAGGQNLNNFNFNSNNTIYGNSYEFFDPMSWILDDTQALGFSNGLGMMGDGGGDTPTGF